jgi:ABC-type branched-subunit amino acid transport system substrate-binding protein
MATAALTALGLMAGCGSGPAGAPGTNSKSTAQPPAGSAASASKPPVTLGVLGLAGSPADAPEAGPAGLAAANYINHQLGGVNGRPIHAIVCNDQGTPESVTQCANTFISAHAAAVVAYVTGSEPQLVTPLAAARIPVVINTPNSVGLMSPDVIGLSASSFEALLMPALYGEKHGLKSSAMILVNTPDSQAVINLVLPFYKKAGVALTYQIASPGNPDLTPAVASAITRHPASLSILGGVQFCASGLKATHTLGYTGSVFLTTCVGPELVKAVGAMVSGAIAPSVGTGLDLSPQDKSRYLAAMAKYGRGIDPFAPSVVRMFANVALTASVLRSMPPNSAYPAAAVLAAFHALHDHRYFLDGGVPLTCNGLVVAIAPSVCSATTFVTKFVGTTLTADGYADFASLLSKS